MFKPLACVILFAAAASLLSAETDPSWTRPFPPHKIMGNLYYVGSEALASFLVVTPQGLILINSNLESSVPQIEKSITQLGFHFEDIKILLISHAHVDHCAGSAAIKRRTHARYMVMDADVAEIEDGGRSDFQYARSKDMQFPPVKVDRILHDQDTVELGGSVLTAHRTAGHTKGCTTWSLKVKQAGKTYDAVIVGSPYVNSGYKLVNNSEYPAIAQDYRQGLRTLSLLPCDLFLGAHDSYYDLETKYAKLQKGVVEAFVDPAGYKAYVADRQQAFETELKRQETKR